MAAWAKGDSVPRGVFAVQAAFITAGAPQWETLSFNRDGSDWQYVSDIVKAKSPYSRIDIYLISENNANTEYFDGVQFYKEEFGDSYAYDSNGNLASVTDIAKQNSSFQTNNSNDLTSYTDPKGSQFKYEYDAKHNVTKGTSAGNVVYSFSYDPYGNPLTSKVGDSTLFMNSSSSYTWSGNYQSSLTDSSGNTTSKSWNETKGILNSSTDPKGNAASYLYDNNSRLVSVSKNPVGQQSNPQTANPFKQDALSGTAYITNTTPDGYDVIVNLSSVKLPVGIVYFPTWTNSNGQDDIIWGAGTRIGDSTWKYHVSRLDHKGEYGLYTTHVYVSDAEGSHWLTGLSANLDSTTSKYITTISNVTSNGYDVSVTTTALGGAITTVLFPTWSDVNGQDDLIWGTGTQVNSNTWTYHVNRSDHKGDFGGYSTHTYAYNAQGALEGFSYTHIDILQPTFNVQTVNISPNGYDVTAQITPGSSPISRVSFPTWTTNNGQDDLIWRDGTKIGINTWLFHVNRLEHLGEYGTYFTDIYAYDDRGNAYGWWRANPTLNPGITNSYSYENDRIKSITHNGFSYNFGYDSSGNNTTVSAGSQTLITNSYEPRTSKLLGSTYGNNQQVSSDYDSLDRVIARKYNGSTRYTYKYDASGNVGYQQDLVNAANYRYVYDISNRLVQVEDSTGNLLSYSYDANNNQSKVSDKVNGTAYETNYAYDKDNKPTSITYNRATSNNISMGYDALGRLTTNTVSTGS